MRVITHLIVIVLTCDFAWFDLNARKKTRNGSVRQRARPPTSDWWTTKMPPTTKYKNMKGWFCHLIFVRPARMELFSASLRKHTHIEPVLTWVTGGVIGTYCFHWRATFIVFFFLLFARQFNIIFFFVETKDFMDRNCWKIIVIEPNDDCAVWCQSAAATIAACLPVAVDIFCIWSPLPLHVVTLRGSMRVRETTDTHTRMTQIRMCVRGGIVLCFHPTWNGTTQWISGREGRKLARTRC